MLLPTIRFLTFFVNSLHESLPSIELPNSITEIGVQAFDGCYSLKSITSLNTTPQTVIDDYYYCCPIKDDGAKISDSAAVFTAFKSYF